MFSERGILKQHWHTFVFAFWTVIACLVFGVFIGLLVYWLLLNTLSQGLVDTSDTIALVVGIAVNIIIIFILRQSYLQFRDKHVEHAEDINSGIMKFVESCQICVEGNKIQLTWTKPPPKVEDFPFGALEDTKPARFWDEAVQHLKSTKAYEVVYTAHSEIIKEISDYNKEVDNTKTSIKNKIEIELKKTFPKFKYNHQETGGYISKECIVGYLWRLYWLGTISKKPIHLRPSKVKRSDKKPYTQITADGFSSHTIAMIPEGAKITIDDIKKFIDALILKPEYEEEIVPHHEKYLEIEKRVKNFKLELDKLTKTVKSNKDIAGKCDFCPKMFF